jgi:hypothetical protein
MGVASVTCRRTLSLSRYVRLLRDTLKDCELTRQARLTLSRARRAPNPVAWITNFKTTCRQFARPLP